MNTLEASTSSDRLGSIEIKLCRFIPLVVISPRDILAVKKSITTFLLHRRGPKAIHSKAWRMLLFLRLF